MSVIAVQRFWEERDEVIRQQKRIWELYEALRNFIFGLVRDPQGKKWCSTCRIDCDKNAQKCPQCDSLVRAKLWRVFPSKFMSPKFPDYTEFMQLLSDIQASMIYILSSSEMIVGEQPLAPPAPTSPPPDKFQYVLSIGIIVVIAMAALYGASVNQTYVDPALATITTTVATAATTYTTVLTTQSSSTVRSHPILSGEQALLLIVFGGFLSVFGIFVLPILLARLGEGKKEEEKPLASEDLVSKNLDEIRDAYAGAFGIEPDMRIPAQIAAQLEKTGHTITAGGARRFYTWKFQFVFPKKLGIVMSVVDRAAWQRRSELTKKVMEVSRPAPPPRQFTRPQPFQQG